MTRPLLVWFDHAPGIAVGMVVGALIFAAGNLVAFILWVMR